MSNRVFIPAFQCTVGDWKYYMCTMKYAEVARGVSFAYELSGKSTDLATLIQRGLSERTKEISEYLLRSKHRFLGSLVVAAWGGEPQYTKLEMDDPDGMLKGIDQGFGVLIFDGTQQYFALDGQHRLKAIKNAIKQDPSIGKEDICVLLVTHYDTSEGRVRTRRLFSNINKNAKQTGAAENIALDEDNGFAILTRRLLDEHPFLSPDGRVRVILGQNDEGELRLASSSVPKTEKTAVTTFTVLFDMIRYLSWDLPGIFTDGKSRPTDEELESAYEKVSQRLSDLFLKCGNLEGLVGAAASMRDVRAPKDREQDGHPLLRPLIQKVVTKVAFHRMRQKLETWEELLEGLSGLSWRLGDAPWTAVYNVNNSRMVGAKENAELLADLLSVHLGARTKEQVRTARKAYKDLKAESYPFEEEVLFKRLKANGTGDGVVEAVPEFEELSEKIAKSEKGSSKADED
jgi:DNA sulfur modification protein DndB